MRIDASSISLNRLARALCTDNLRLLTTIRDDKPEALTELATLSGRSISNLSRTIKTLEGLGLVKTVTKDGRKLLRLLWQGDKITLVFKR
jgi:predicted transcriptional regulator